MKKVLLTMGVFALTLGAKAQLVFQEDFQAGGITWTNVDNNADTYKWNFVDFQSGDGQGKVANSASWIKVGNNGVVLTPDNLLISPAITLGTTNLLLTYKVKGQDANFSNEHYAVYVTPTNVVTDITSATPVLVETLPNGTANYLIKQIDLSAFSGQTVYLTFRHYISSDVFSINIDDVWIGARVDSKLVGITIPSGVNPGNVSIKGTIVNNGTAPITSLNISYDAGTGPITATIPSLNIAPNATYTFTHPTPLAVVSGGLYSVNVCATITNDENTANDCQTGKIDFVAYPATPVTKYVVVEEKTGTWCGWCPRGTVALNKLHANEPKAFEIAIHNSDPMAVSSYDSGTSGFPDFGGYPYTSVDRVEGTDPGSVVPAVNTRKTALAPASISFDASTISGNTITITPKVTMGTNMNGDYRIAVVLIEEDVTGTGASWLQTNYYYDGTSGPLVDQDGTNWSTLTHDVDQSALMGGYDHVARALANNVVNGSANSLPSTLTNGQSYTHTYTFTKGATWDVNKMHAVAMLVKNSTGEVLNAGQTAITGTAGLTENVATAFGVEAYPNPSNGAANVKVALENESSVSISVYNMIGEVVYQVPTTTLAAGTHVYPVNLMNAQSGVYFAHVSVNGTNQVVKINVVK